MQVSDEMVTSFCRANPNHHDLSVNEIRDGIAAALNAMWRPINEVEPNRSYLLGWRDWRDDQWCVEVAAAITGQRFENGYSNVSHHGSATHFMPLPSPPAGEK